MRIKSHALILVSVFVIIFGISLFYFSKSRTFQFFGGLVSCVNTDNNVIALTFDDAPTEKVTEVLNILNEKGIKATFYEIGKQIEDNQKVAKEISDSGMEIGNHTYLHQRMVFKTWSFIDSEIQKTNLLIRDTGYQGEITFRPPNGKKLFLLPYYLYQKNMKTIMWDVEPDTYVSGNAALIEKYVLDTVKPGSIILMHPFCDVECEADRKALPIIIDRLQSRGYQFVTISELLKYRK